MAQPAVRFDQRQDEILAFASHKHWCPAHRREGWSALHSACGCGLDATRLSMLASAAPRPRAAEAPWEELAAELPKRADGCRHRRRELRRVRAAFAEAHALLGDLARIEVAWGGDGPSELISEAHAQAMRLTVEVNGVEGALREADLAWQRAREARRLDLLWRRMKRHVGFHDEQTPALLALRSQIAGAWLLVEMGTPLHVRMAREAGLAVERSLRLLEEVG